MNVLILGGGFAGLSAAVHLAAKNNKIILLEASPKLGGRAYSFYDKETDTVIDNGQHIMMGCYDYTLEFFDIIGANDKLEIQENLNVTFLGRGGEKFNLLTRSSLHPFNLSRALMSFSALSIHDRLKVIDFFLDLAFTVSEDLIDKSVEEWLIEKGQSPESIKSLWEILAIGTLNSSIQKAAASSFCTVLKAMFLRDNFSSKIILPKSGLSQMYCNTAENYLLEHGAVISKSERAIQLKTEGNRVIEVVTTKSVYADFDFVISALPHYSLKNIFNDNDGFLSELNLEYSPIINIHIWLKEQLFEERFVGLIDSDFHWVFNNGTHITVTTSSANKLLKMTDEELKEKLFKELKSYLPVFSPNLVVIYKVIREKRATFIPTSSIEKRRMLLSNPYINLRLAGDWTNTGLPATIEGAVKSGFNAAEAI